VLAGYHARTAMAELGRIEEALRDALEKTEGKSLMVKYQYAVRYACAKADAAMYGSSCRKWSMLKIRTLIFVLTNTIAKRRAKRWMSEKRMFDACRPRAHGSAGSCARDTRHPPSSMTPAARLEVVRNASSFDRAHAVRRRVHALARDITRVREGRR